MVKIKLPVATRSMKVRPDSVVMISAACSTPERSRSFAVWVTWFMRRMASVAWDAAVPESSNLHHRARVVSKGFGMAAANVELALPE